MKRCFVRTAVITAVCLSGGALAATKERRAALPESAAVAAAAAHMQRLELRGADGGQYRRTRVREVDWLIVVG
jgi:hypothetical protein